jgi:inner membrane protein
MDSVTHIVVGAALGDRLLGAKLGRKAAWIGALASSFPDFDLLYSGISDARNYILYHRSYTHSFFIEALTAFPMAYLFYILFKRRISYPQWFFFWLIAMWLHSCMDWFTNYGTRLFLPFSEKIFAFNSISILDLFLTVPLLLLIIPALIARNESNWRKKLTWATLAYTVLYFSITVFQKVRMEDTFRSSLQAQEIKPSEMMTNPTILNNFLWYGVANVDSMVYIGEYSSLQKEPGIQWMKFPTNRHLLAQCPSPDARMLEWFSNGYVSCIQNEDTLEVFCLKFGRGDLSQQSAKKTFLFYYQIYKENDVWQFRSHEPKSQEIKMEEGFKQLVKRIQTTSI